MLYFFILFFLMIFMVILGDKLDNSIKNKCINCKNKECNWSGRTDIYY